MDVAQVTGPAVLRALSVVVALASMLLLPSAAVGQATTSTTTSTGLVGFIITSPCSGEQISVLEEFRFVMHSTQTPSGDTTTFSQVTSAGATGTGLTSGDTYQVVNVFAFRDDPSGAPYAATLTLTQQFIGPGPDDNFVSFITIHFTIDANGEGHADVQRVDTECR